MNRKRRIISRAPLEQRILTIRGHKVLLDADLSALYGVSTKRLNEQVKRNQHRFPADFIFQLTQAEKREVVANCDHLARLKFSAALPRAFTEHGALMAANVLNSAAAVQMSVFVVRAFIRLSSEIIASKSQTAKREKTSGGTVWDSMELGWWGLKRELTRLRLWRIIVHDAIRV
jgi:hypothetical protein